MTALSLEPGKRSVMHLVARENLPEPATQGNSILNEVVIKVTSVKRSLWERKCFQSPLR